MTFCPRANKDVSYASKKHKLTCYDDSETSHLNPYAQNMLSSNYMGPHVPEADICEKKETKTTMSIKGYLRTPSR